VQREQPSGVLLRPQASDPLAQVKFRDLHIVEHLRSLRRRSAEWEARPRVEERPNASEIQSILQRSQRGKETFRSYGLTLSLCRRSMAADLRTVRSVSRMEFPPYVFEVQHSVQRFNAWIPSCPRGMLMVLSRQATS